MIILQSASTKVIPGAERRRVRKVWKNPFLDSSNSIMAAEEPGMAHLFHAASVHGTWILFAEAPSQSGRGLDLGSVEDQQGYQPDGVLQMFTGVYSWLPVTVNLTSLRSTRYMTLMKGKSFCSEMFRLWLNISSWVLSVTWFLIKMLSSLQKDKFPS